MTEKRFTIDNFGFIFDDEELVDDVVGLLNAQHEEIQQSKVLIKKYHNENTDLIKENEQLKLKGLEVLEFYVQKLKTSDDIEKAREELFIVKQVLHSMGLIE